MARARTRERPRYVVRTNPVENPRDWLPETGGRVVTASDLREGDVIVSGDRSARVRKVEKRAGKVRLVLQFSPGVWSSAAVAPSTMFLVKRGKGLANPTKISDAELGRRFDSCVRDVSARGGVRSPQAICAASMRRAHGSAQLTKIAARGRSRAAAARRRR